MKMVWEKLLCEQRISGKPSQKAAGDLRSEFEKDYDRSVFSTPVRRLQDKAQVFLLETHDAVRTRLTHSLEVSTVASDLAHAATKWMVEHGEIKLEAKDALAIETIAATCGLIHDLGNPPFGHAGERAISSWFNKNHAKLKLFDFKTVPKLVRKKQMEDDFLWFEGNAQTIRLVSKLQLLSNFYGLNLTLGTLSAACKYTAASDEANGDSDNHARHKPGFFASENELIKRVRRTTGTGSSRNPITFLVEAADDIVYSTVDIEDAIKKGIVSWAYVKEQLHENVDSKIYGDLMGRIDRYLDGGGLKLSGKNKDEVYSQVFRIYAISILAPSVVDAFKANYGSIMTGEYDGELVKDCSASTLVKTCKAVGKTCIYSSNETMRLEVMGRDLIHDLMDIFWEGASHTQKHARMKDFPFKIYSLMSENYRVVFEENLKTGNLPAQYYRMQLVTDYICGMTDTFAQTIHQQLKNG